MTKTSRTAIALLALAAGGWTARADAAITVVSDYKLGEADPGAVAGHPANSTTVDSVGGNNLTLGTASFPTYSASNDSMGNGTIRGIAGSTMSVDFAGNTYYSGSVPSAIANGPLSGLDTGSEAWINQPTAATQLGLIEYAGNTGGSGAGLYVLADNHLGLLIGGVNLVDTGAVLPVDTWTQVGLTFHLNLSTFAAQWTVYLNGAPVGGATNLPNAIGPSDYLAIGGRPNGPGAVGEPFIGKIDDVRFFTATPGSFDPSHDFNIGPALATPEPNSLALVLIGAVALGWPMFRLKRRKLSLAAVR